MRIAPPALGGRLRACHSRRRRVPDLKARPMLLAIDAGNTNVVFALVKDREIRARWRIATDTRRTADEYAGWRHQLPALEGYDSIRSEARRVGKGWVWQARLRGSRCTK